MKMSDDGFDIDDMDTDDMWEGDENAEDGEDD